MTESFVWEWYKEIIKYVFHKSYRDGKVLLENWRHFLSP